MRAFDNCLVCGASTENTHSARRGSDALVCGGDCYKQASRNFKRNMSGYKVARLVDLLAQMGGPVTAAQLLARYRDTYGKSAMMGFNNTNAVTQQLMPIVNPETIRVDKTKNPFTFEYLGGTTIGEWLKPSMRAKYESVSFRSETFAADSTFDSSEYAPTERIIQRLKHSGVWELGDPYAGDGWDAIKWWATVNIKDGTLVRATEEELIFGGDLTAINIILIGDQYANGYGRVTVSYTDVDNADWEDSYNDEMEQLRKELTIILKNNRMFQSGDFLEYGGMGEFFNVHWDDLVNHSCADNAKFDIYEEDEGQGLITMECMECGRTSTFRQETPYEGPRNAETFEAEVDNALNWEILDSLEVGDKIDLIVKRSGRNNPGFGREEGMRTTTVKEILDGLPSSHRKEVAYMLNPYYREAWKTVETLSKHLKKIIIFDNGETILLLDRPPSPNPDSTYCHFYFKKSGLRFGGQHNWDNENKYRRGLIVGEIKKSETFAVEAYEILDSETFGAEDQQKLDVSVGDRVRSYDFVLPDGTLIRDDCYMEGRVTKIAPVDWCGSECNHYYILVDKIVRNGEALSERMPGVDMVYPPVSESYLEVINETFAAEHETFEVETDEYKGPFSVEIRRPNGSIVSWKKYDDYRQLIDALEDIVSNRYTPYAIDVFATQVSYISGFTAMGPVNDYRKFHLATWKYGNWESGPWAEYLPTGLE